MPEEITSSGLQEQNGDADAVVEAALHAELARALGVAHGDIALSQRFNHRKVIVPDVTSKFFLQAKGDGESWLGVDLALSSRATIAPRRGVRRDVRRNIL